MLIIYHVFVYGLARFSFLLESFIAKMRQIINKPKPPQVTISKTPKKEFQEGVFVYDLPTPVFQQFPALRGFVYDKPMCS